MMRTLALCAAFAAAMACTPTARDDLTRAAARNAIRPVVAQRLPGVPVEPAIDCIINSASANELLGLASDAVTGPTASTVQTVTQIASRPEAIQCLASEGLPGLLRQ